jgi:hypothetical protein
MTSTKLEIPFDIVTESWMAGNEQELAELCRLSNAAGGPAERAATLLFLWHLTTNDPFALPEYEQASWKAMLGSANAMALSMLTADDIDEPWWIRWELLYAAAAEQWDRSQELVRRWIAVAPTEERSARSALARVLAVSVQPVRQRFIPDWWLPYEGAGDAEFGTELVWLRSLHLGEASSAVTGVWEWPSSLDDRNVGRVLDAANALAHLDHGGELPKELAALRAWCDAVTGVRRRDPFEIRQAADQYRRIADKVPDAIIASIPFSSAVLLYRLGDDVEGARQTAVKWTERAPDDADAWRLRAQLGRLLGLGTGAVADSYEHFVRLSPDSGDSWEHSELLRLLLESRDNETAQRALAEVALTHPERSVAVELVGWDWPAFGQLSNLTREFWWKGLVFVCDPRVRQAFRGTPWRNAAADFGEAVAAELRARIFGPFAEWDGFKRARLTGKDDSIGRAIERSRATFGTMAAVMRRTGDSRSALGQLLAVFLHQFHRPLRQHLRDLTALDRLEQAVSGRNDAAHGDVSMEQARHVYRDSKAFLEVLAAEDPRRES